MYIFSLQFSTIDSPGLSGVIELHCVLKQLRNMYIERLCRTELLLESSLFLSLRKWDIARHNSSVPLDAVSCS